MHSQDFQDDASVIQRRVADLLERMTIEEKVGQLVQYFYLPFELPAGFDIESIPAEERGMLDQPKRIEAEIAAGLAGSVLMTTDPATTNRLQRIAVEQSRLGIPLLIGMDVIHGLRTIFPVPIGMAATWSPEDVREANSLAAREARAVGIHWAFSPMVDVTRDPRWGRIIEGAGEDPTLGAAIAAAQVRGFQGELGAENILAGPKHFAGYGFGRGGRDYEEADVSLSDFYNVVLPPFRAAIQAGARNVMSAYMDLNGVPASGNEWLLQSVLRNELGFDGFVVSDANAVRSLEVQHFAQDQTDAAVRALQAGVDLEMCTVAPAYRNLTAAVTDGRVPIERIDQAVAALLTAKFGLGLFDHPYVDEDAAATLLSSGPSRDRAETFAERSIVLLRNEGSILPLRAETLHRVAVIGELADSKRDTLGPWVFAHDTAETVTVLEGLRSRLPDSVTIDYAPGAQIPGRLFPSIFDVLDPAVTEPAPRADEDADIAHAVAIAEEADVAIVVVGQRQNQIGEKASIDTLELSGRQLEQLQAITATGTPVVLLVMSGRPLDLRWAADNVAAIAQIWYPGSRGGHAVASMLLGDTVPAGRLPFSWPRHVGQVPIVYSHYRTFEPQDLDKRYFNETSTPLYPFGHGLSYAAFEYGDCRIPAPVVEIGQPVVVEIDVTNVSDVDADEVVQLYVHQRFGTSTRPLRELKAFTRIPIPAASTVTASFELSAEQLRYWSEATRGYVQDETTFDVWVGGSSEAESTAQFEVRGTRAKDTPNG